MNKDLVSVIIPNYNYAKFLGAAVASVLDQTYPSIEVIVVDDGSTDSSREVLVGFGDKVRTIFQQNQGVAASRNNGVAASLGKFVAFLDADDLWLADKISAQIDAFDDNSAIGLVHCGVIEIDQDGNDLRTRINGGSGAAVWRAMLEFSRHGVLGGGSGVMIRRDVFDDLGGFDTRLSTSADWDLYYRISRRYEVGFVEGPLLKYRVHGSNMHGNIGVMERDMTLAFEKAFSEQADDLSAVKRRAYGCLHQNLAGSFFSARDFGAFVRHSFRSIACDLSNIRYFLRFPRRGGRA